MIILGHINQKIRKFEYDLSFHFFKVKLNSDFSFSEYLGEQFGKGEKLPSFLQGFTIKEV